ncbi:uncharacterized protein V1518DRAFT_418939 [Limtongia smithiae]|uniref:uncharacterized protein n=1 Tax=Limtongia smithiae TaxID=1125753 RepID=UPI0034CDCB89
MPLAGRVLMTHYEALNILPSASATEIKKQFYALSKQYHPDRVLTNTAPERARARKRFDAVSLAYSVLGNADKRREYDLKLRAEAAADQHEAENAYYRTSYERRQTHYSGLNRTRARPSASASASSTNAASGQQSSPNEFYYDAQGNKIPRSSHPFNLKNSGLGGGYATGMNDDVPHFDYEAHRRQQAAYELFRAKRQKGGRVGLQRPADGLFESPEEATTQQQHTQQQAESATKAGGSQPSQTSRPSPNVSEKPHTRTPPRQSYARAHRSFHGHLTDHVPQTTSSASAPSQQTSASSHASSSSPSDASSSMPVFTPARIGVISLISASMYVTMVSFGVM